MAHEPSIHTSRIINTLANRLAIHLLALNPQWGAVSSGNGYYEINGDGNCLQEIQEIRTAIDAYEKQNPVPAGFGFLSNNFEMTYALKSGKRVAFIYEKLSGHA